MKSNEQELQLITQTNFFDRINDAVIVNMFKYLFQRRNNQVLQSAAYPGTY